MKKAEFKLSKKLENAGRTMTSSKAALLTLSQHYGDRAGKFWVEFMKEHPELEDKEMTYDSRTHTVKFMHDSDEREWLRSKEKEGE